MNTKTEGISSGLVAVAWIAPDGDRFRVRICEERPTDAPLWSPMCWISDAEAIIAAKDAEIERLALYKNLADEYGLSVFADLKEQSAALKLASLALSEGVEYVEEPPEKNCTCHLSPPCNDCVDHSAVREFFIDARKALAAIDALGDMK